MSLLWRALAAATIMLALVTTDASAAHRRHHHRSNSHGNAHGVSLASAQGRETVSGHRRHHHSHRLAQRIDRRTRIAG